MIRPADHFVRERGMSRECRDHAARQVEDHVVGSAGQPDDDVVLGRRQHVAGWADQRLVEAGDSRWGGVRGNRRPQLRSKSGDQVDAADRRSRFPQACDASHHRRTVGPGDKVELEVGMGRRPKREDASLG